MAAIGTVASVFAVLQLTSKVTGICYNYIIAVKVASKVLKAIINETRNLESILLRLADIGEPPDEAQSVSLLGLAKAPDGPLNRCFIELGCLETLLRSSPASHATRGRCFKRAGTAIMWPLKQKAINRSLEIIRREQETLNLALTGDTTATVRSVKLGVESIQATQKDEHRRMIVQWLMITDPSSYHTAARRKHEPTTGGWFLDSHVFNDWKHGKTRFVWIHGIPGCGKSILCSSIIEATIAHWAGQPEYATAYFYFDFNYGEKGQVAHFLGSVIAQLCSKAGDMPNAVQTLYGKASQQGSWPSSEDLLNVLRELVELQTQTLLIVDALDECTERTELLEVLSTIGRWEGTRVSILATSRKERDIHLGLKGIVSDEVSIQTSKVRPDMRKFVSSRISENVKLRDWPEATKSEIKTSLVDGADGMFRWVVCQLEALQSCVTPAALKRTLTTLPKTLPDTYDRILINIDEEHREIALKVLQWLAYSLQPLTLSEVADALAVKVGTFSIDPDDRLIDPRDILTICSSLVTIAHDEGCGERITLAHCSVKEYLVSRRIKAGPASFYSLSENSSNSAIAEACLTYCISLKNFISENPETLEKKYPLASYAFSYWYNHARKASGSESDSSLVTLSLLFYKHLWDGLVDTARALLEGGADVSYRGGLSDLPLIIAAKFGHTEVVRLLLEHGAVIDAENENALRASGRSLSRAAGPAEIGGNCMSWGLCERQHGNALHTAVDWGHMEAVSVLLDAGARVNAIDTYDYSTAIQRAAANGNEKIVRLLLDCGADPNIKGRFGSSLTIATRARHTRTAKLLIERGADVNSFGGPDGYPLIAAVYYGSKDIIRLLLDHGADINATGGVYGSSLCAAILTDENTTDVLEITQLLLSRGADPNADIAGHRGRPLYLASKRSFFDVMHMLIEKGADVNTYGGNWATALHATAWDFGNCKAMLLLLDNGADVNTITESGGTAIEAAIAIGDEESIELLLDRGADLALAIRECRIATPLQIAVRCCSFSRPSLQSVVMSAERDLRALLRTLKSLGKIAQGDSEFDKTLIGAAISSCTRPMEMLFEEVPSLTDGASKDRLERALIDATRAGSHAVVKLLLDKGVTPNAIDKYSHRDRGDTALQVAWKYGFGSSSSDHNSVAKELLERGARGQFSAGTTHAWVDLTGWLKGTP